jgi:hypothetical protein
MRKEMMENEGITGNVDENKGAIFDKWGIHLTQVAPICCGRKRPISVGGASSLVLWRP